MIIRFSRNVLERIDIPKNLKTKKPTKPKTNIIWEVKKYRIVFRKFRFINL